MKNALKISFGAILALGLSTAHAHLDNRLLQHSSIAVTGTYTQTSNNGFSTGDYLLAPAANNIVARRAAFISTDSEFDYGLAYTYHYPGCPTRFFVTYDHFNTQDNNSALGQVVNLGVGPLPVPPAVLLTDVFGRITQRADELRFGFTHNLGFGKRFKLDLSGFFEWDKVRLNLYETLVDNATADVYFRETSNKVDGWGPGVGAFARMLPFCNYYWGFFVDAKTTLLWADNEFFSYLQDSSSVVYLNPEESHSLVGKLDLKVGVDYCRILHSGMGHFLFEAALGLRYMNMFNAIKNGNTFYNPLAPATGYAMNTGYPNDWGRFGPFLTLRIGGAHA